MHTRVCRHSIKQAYGETSHVTPTNIRRSTYTNTPKTKTHLATLRAGALADRRVRHPQEPPEVRGEAARQAHPATARLEEEELVPVYLCFLCLLVVSFGAL